MWHIGRRIGPPLLGAVLLSLLGLAPAAAQGIYGGGYTGGSAASSYTARSPSVYRMPAAPYGATALYGSTYGARQPNYNSPATSAYGTGYGDGSRLYTIRFGDTLGRIAARFHTTVGALLRANPSIVNPNRIFAGRKLVIPGSRSAPKSAGGYAPPANRYAAPSAPPAAAPY